MPPTTMSPRVDRDLADGPVAEVKQVAQHLPLGRSEVAALDRLVLGLVDRVLDLLAKRLLMGFAEQQ